MFASHIDRLLPVVAIALVTVGANVGFPGEAIAQTMRVNCADADKVARNAYLGIIKSVEGGDYESLGEHKRIFWDVEEYSRHCESIQKMAGMLILYDFGRDTAALRVQGNSSSGTTKSSRGVVNATVLAIESMPLGTDTGTSGTSASSGSAGATGASGASGARAYRVTVRMDDGSTQVITQDTTPDFRSGDRVNVTAGSIHRD